MINVYEYLDYKRYLEDYYHFMKMNSTKFSFRWFARKAGYSSSGYYSNVIKGVHPLSGSYVDKFIQGLELDDLEANYFHLLVKYQNAKSVVEKKKYLDELSNVKPSHFFRLKQSHHLYYSHWYISVVHQALGVFSYTNEAKALSDFIRPRLKKQEVIESIDLLKKLNLIVQDEDGYWRPMDPSSVGGSEVGVNAIRNFQKELMSRAQESVDFVAPENRHIISTTLTANAQGVQDIKNMITDLQNKIIGYSDSHVDHDKLYHLNVQFFPMSRGQDEDKY
jgi:uncharacterized protein (TIGR02147 family)